MKRPTIILALALIAGFASASLAVPIENTNNDGIEDRMVESTSRPFAHYQNSGQFLFIQEGNNNSLSTVQTALNALAPYSSVTLSLAGVNWTSYDGNSGTWSTDPSTNTISFYLVKAANAYALYLVNPADSMGSWSTFDLWLAGYGGHPKNGGGGLEISHFTGYNPNTPVPEPGTILLLGAGLVGLGLYGRKRVKA